MSRKDRARLSSADVRMFTWDTIKDMGFAVVTHPAFKNPQDPWHERFVGMERAVDDLAKRHYDLVERENELRQACRTMRHDSETANVC